MLFFEMLTGLKPFYGKDIMDTIHHHIAIHAPVLSSINSTIPLPLERVIQKQLAKDPNDRYHSTLGLQYDLEQILFSLRKGELDAEMQPGTLDVRDSLFVSTRIFGREKDLAILKRKIEELAGGEVGFIQLSGTGGIGKSSLLKELKGALESEGYLLASAHFSSSEQHIPLSGILEVFKDIIRRILSEKEEVLIQWKTQLQEVLEQQAPYIAEVVPAIEKLLGPQTKRSEALPKDSEDRLKKALIDFLSIFTFDDKPLILLLDDLQYCDSAGLSLLDSLVRSGRVKNLLLVASSRDEVVTAEFESLIQGWKEAKMPYYAHKIEPLSIQATEELLADVFGPQQRNVYELARLITQKTKGIPLLLREFISNANQKKYFTFSRKTLDWKWDLDFLSSLPVPDSVADLLVLKLGNLSGNCRQLLEYASILGEVFRFDDLRRLMQLPELETASRLNEAVILGIINHHTIDPSSAIVDAPGYAFAHLRVHSVISESIPDEQNKRIRFDLGKIYLERGFQELSGREELFKVANNFHAALEFWIDKGDAGDQVKRWFYEAAKKARLAFSYELAENYISGALSLMDEEVWDRNFDLAFGISLEGIKCRYLSGNKEGALVLFEQAASKERHVNHKVRRCLTLQWLYINDSRTEDALNMAIQALQSLGIRIPKNPNQGHMLLEIIRTRLALGFRPLKRLRRLEINTDPDALLQSELLYWCLPPASATNVNLQALLSLKLLQVYARFGRDPYGISGIMMYGFVLAGGFGDYENGFRFIELGVAESRKFNDPFGIGNSLFGLGLLGTLKLPIRDLLEPMQEAYINFDICGDTYLASTCTSTMSGNRFLLGRPLAEIGEKLSGYILYSEKAKDNNTINLHLNLQKQINVLCTDELVEDHIVEAACGNSDKMDKTHRFWTNSYQMLVCYLLKKERKGLEHSALAKKDLANQLFLMIDFVYFYYDSLLLARTNLNGSPADKRNALLGIRKNLKRIEPRGKKAPLAFAHMMWAIKACEKMMLGEFKMAYSLLEKAMENLHPDEYIHDKAIFYEMQALICTLLSETTKAHMLIQKAYDSFWEWGAKAVCYQLALDHPEIVTVNSKLRGHKAESSTPIHSKAGLPEDPNMRIDLGSVLKASQAISTEIELPKLLESLLRILMQNAGATRGVLVMPIKGVLCVMAEGSTDKQELKTLQKIPITDVNAGVPVTVINYAARSQEVVSIED
ncbi:MAG: ATP-binding protein, partial [Bacteroidia bacterium]